MNNEVKLKDTTEARENADKVVDLVRIAQDERG